jgi:hypothetical protein
VPTRIERASLLGTASDRLTIVGETSADKKTGAARWWDTISHHPLWAALIAALLAGGIAAHSGGVFDGGASNAQSVGHSPHKTQSQARPLRATFVQVAPVIYEIAFNRPISLPKSTEEWGSLHSRGGVDVGESNFRLTLANQTDSPLTVTGIQAVVYRSQSPPTTTLASVYTQGAALLEEFGVELTSAAVGATAQFHKQERGEIQTMAASIAPLFFRRHDITLASGEIYEAKVQVSARVNDELEYGFVVMGNTARSGFSYHLTPHFKIASYGQELAKFQHSYLWLPQPLGGPCWIVPYEPSDGQEPHCP